MLREICKGEGRLWGWRRSSGGREEREAKREKRKGKIKEEGEAAMGRNAKRERRRSS